MIPISNLKSQISFCASNTKSNTPTPTPPPARGLGPICPAAFPMQTTPPAHSSRFRNLDAPITDAMKQGLTWLLDLQNRDGGIPTFCRGWGHLPFDRSGADLTAHALHAWSAWRAVVEGPLQQRIDHASNSALVYLKNMQRSDGSWEPLWFGNQFVADDLNFTYGTARVISALANLDPQLTEGILPRGVAWLIAAQNLDGSWGGGQQSPPSIEETGVAAQALAVASSRLEDPDPAKIAAIHGVNWLIEKTDSGQHFLPAPIGFYFAKLWYFERDYPLIFTTAALGAVRKMISTM